MAFEEFLPFEPLGRLTRNPFTLIKGLDKCRGRVNLVVGGETLGGALWLMWWGSWKGSSTL